MSVSNYSEATGAPREHQVDSRLADYDVDDFWQVHGSFAGTLIVQFVLCGVLLILDLVLLLTCISPEARAKPATWYLYHLIGFTVLSGVIVIPMEFTGNLCRTSLFLSRVSSGVRGMNMILINIEIIATVLAPQALWERYRKCRFFISVGFIWLFNIVLMGTILAVGRVRYEYHDKQCYIYGQLELLLLHAFKNWLPGVLLIGFTVAAFVSYNRLRTNGFYNQISGNSGETVQCREWFVCLLVLNSMYILLDVLLYEVHMFMVEHFVTEVVILALTNLVVFVLPFSMLALKEIRMALKEGAIVAWACLCERHERVPRSPTESGQNIILNMDTINDESL